MNVKIVQQLADIMLEKDLASLEYCEGEDKISLVRAVGAMAGTPATVPVAAAQPAAAPAPEAEAPQAARQASGDELISPLVGIGYVAASPDEPPFVQVGTRVEKGQVLCIIESMKVMNEFTAPRAGEVTEICFENGQLLEFGQPLFRLK